MASGWANDDAVNEQDQLIQLKMRLPALGVKFRVAKARMNVKSAVPPSASRQGSHSACAYAFIVAVRRFTKPAYTGYESQSSLLLRQLRAHQLARCIK